jgi:hypothetical protein
MSQQEAETHEEKPPFFSSWNKLYALVIGELVVLVLLFYLFTQAFS